MRSRWAAVGRGWAKHLLQGRVVDDRFLRLILPGTFGGDAEVIKAAEDLWKDAIAAVRAYKGTTA
jgi:hypothetical protein